MTSTVVPLTSGLRAIEKPQNNILGLRINDPVQCSCSLSNNEILWSIRSNARGHNSWCDSDDYPMARFKNKYNVNRFYEC